MGIEPVTERIVVECEGERGALWLRLSDTDRLNRIAGLTSVQIRDNPEPGAARSIVTAKFGPLTLEWAELPFEWHAPERLSVRREVRAGLVSRIDFSMGLTPLDAGRTNVEVQLSLTPRQRTAQPVAAVAARVVARRLAEGVRTLAATGSDGLATQGRADARALQMAIARIVEGAPDRVRGLASRLAAHLDGAEDAALARIRPYELADAWGEDRRATLELCLRAVVAGALDLHWDVVCPSCRTAAERLPTLADLDGKAHCGQCDIGFGLDMDRAVEASFSPAAGVRHVEDVRYCTGGPGATPHVVSQAVLRADMPSALAVPEAPGRYRLFVRGGIAAPVEVEVGGAASASVSVHEGAALEVPALAPGAALDLVWSGAGPRHVKLERFEWASRAATAYEVLTVPEFRAHFGAEALKPGLALEVRRAVLFFSDLSASTALYAREGDAAAFRLVQDHFDLLDAQIRRYGGSVVKTIGDAVMASFVDEAGAMRAALGAQAAFPAFRAAHAASKDVFLKIGVFAGPCYAVSANGVVDFFGQTVNVAARLQGQARDAEVVAPATLVSDLMSELPAETTFVGAPFIPALKGVDVAPEVVRLKIET